MTNRVFSGLGLDQRSDRRDLLIVIALFCISRALYGALGLQFDTSTLPGYMQFLDVELLEHRLLESLWYYHANPPLLNLLAGIGLKWFPGAEDWFFAAIFHLLGIALALSVYLLTCKLSKSRVAAHAATAVLVFSPSFVLYENWLMYSFPAAAMLTVAALLLHKYLETRKTGWCVAFFWTLAALLLTRSLFHLAWLLLVAGLLMLSLRGCRRQVLLAALAPVLLVSLWYGKNYYYFGNFSSSSWMGLGLSNISTLVATPEELQPLVDDGRLSRFALVSRYEQPAELFSLRFLQTGIPALDQIKKPNGAYNFNYLGLVEINRRYTADALTVIRTYPFSYVAGLIISNRLFFSPSDMNSYFSPHNRAAVRPMQKIFNPLLYGVSATPQITWQPHFGFTKRYNLEVNTSVALIVVWILTLGYGYAQARSGLVSRDSRQLPRAIVIGFIVLTALYLQAVGTGLELAENYRYRFLIEPLFTVLVATAITSLVAVLRRRISTRIRVEAIQQAPLAVAPRAPKDPLDRSLVIGLLAAVVMALPGLIMLLPLFGRFVDGFLTHGVASVVAERDFANYWMAARLVLSGEYQDLFVQQQYFPHLLEQFGAGTTIRNWGYPPHFLLLIWPLGLLGYKAAMMAFLSGTLLMFLAAVMVFRRAYAPQCDWTVLLVAVAAYALTVIHIAQNGFLTAALLLFGLAWMKHRPLWAGVAFGLLTIKPQLGLLLPLLLLVDRNWRTFAWSAAVAAALIMISLACFGVDSWRVYLTETLAYQRSVMFDWSGIFLRMMPTTFGSLRSLGWSANTALMAQWVFTAVAATVVLVGLRIERDPLRRIFLIVCGTFVVSPYAFDYDMGALVVIGALLIGAQALRAPVALVMGAIAGLAVSVLWLGLIELPLAPLLLMSGLTALLLDTRYGPVTISEPSTTDSYRAGVAVSGLAPD